MKPLILFLALVCFFSNGCTQAATISQREPEKILYSWDFGSVKEGEVFKHDFMLKNDSQRDLKIEGVNTSCGCTSSVVKKKILMPGESVAIEVSFNSKGYSGQTEQFVYVRTDDIDKPVVRYIIKADVEK